MMPSGAIMLNYRALGKTAAAPVKMPEMGSESAR
jgi:hypothetical protein